MVFADGHCKSVFRVSEQEFFGVILARYLDTHLHRLESSVPGFRNKGAEEKDGTSQINGGRATEGGSGSTSKQEDTAAIAARSSGAGRMA